MRGIRVAAKGVTTGMRTPLAYEIPARSQKVQAAGDTVRNIAHTPRGLINMIKRALTEGAGR